ncbi:MAG: hypothetical protein N3C57_08285 [Aquificaceae bacterium]|nr:hypothetical protein [Aquificaceae bacterium]
MLGHVKEQRTVPLSYHISTLMDVLSLVGGPTTPISKTMVRIDREGRRVEFPLEAVIKNPEYNIYMQPGDVITLVYKTQSATFLGASGKNEELEFEAMGINLSQALGRVGGLQDDRAHAKGLFVFRLEDIEILRDLE